MGGRRSRSNVNSTSLPANHALNFQIQNLYDPLNANPDAIAFIESIGCRAFWNRFGALIESWMKSESDIATQSREMAALFKEVLAFKGVNVGMRDWQACVVGGGEQGRGLAEFAGFDAEGRCARGWSLGGVGSCFDGLVADFWGVGGCYDRGSCTRMSLLGAPPWLWLKANLGIDGQK